MDIIHKQLPVGVGVVLFTFSTLWHDNFAANVKASMAKRPYDFWQVILAVAEELSLRFSSCISVPQTGSKKDPVLN